MIKSDGFAQGIGRGENPKLPAFQNLRDVDFVSGAFLMTPRKLFKRLGGFDTRFGRGYFEEADYCVRLRKLGFRTLYEPSVRLRRALGLEVRIAKVP